MINVKKIAKVAAIVGGINAVMEVSGIIGEAQAMYAMSGSYPDEVNNTLDAFDKAAANGELGGVKIPPYNRFKAKVVSKLTRWCIDNDVFG